MLISQAFAQGAADVTTAAAEAPSFLMSMLPLILIFLVFYVMVIRPQNKRMQEHRTMLNALAKGDKVVTGGGLLAEVVKLQGDDEVVLELADGVKVTALRNTIMMRRNQDAHKTEKK